MSLDSKGRWTIGDGGGPIQLDRLAQPPDQVEPF
jgi:hypothetical protein